MPRAVMRAHSIYTAFKDRRQDRSQEATLAAPATHASETSTALGPVGVHSTGQCGFPERVACFNGSQGLGAERDPW